jgi:hypothetical protein
MAKDTTAQQMLADLKRENFLAKADFSTPFVSENRNLPLGETPMLVTDVQPSDQRVAASLQTLKASCGKSVATATVAKAFGIEDAITAEWPQQLPVRCL